MRVSARHFLTTMLCTTVAAARGRRPELVDPRDHLLN